MSSDTLPLTGLGVLVTRPAHQSEGLCRAIEAAGGQAQRLPLLSIEGPADPAAATARLRDGCAANAWVFTSPNAVSWAARLHPPGSAPDWPGVLAAVGHGTAAALTALGCDTVLVPPRDGANGLLSLPLLHSGSEKRLLIVRGERPLTLLADGLRARGIDFDTVEVYRRRPLGYPPPTITQMLRAVDAVIVSSGESLRQLHSLTPATERSRLLDLQLAVPSTRVLEIAGKLGFHHTPLIPDRVGDEGFTQALVRWRLTIGQNRK